MPPTADGEAYLMTRKVENKTKTQNMQNQEVVQQNTTTILQMWELWRSASWECIAVEPASRGIFCFYVSGKYSLRCFHVSVSLPSG